ncbi:MAG: tryptophan-rich sensory protein [Anaerolineae bacterium]|nr:tryptophan-rich sensory protein [Anaerolineae bacterium]
MSKDVVRQWVNLLALIGTLIVNFASEAIPLNGQTSAQIANRLPILFVPANYVFSIWGIIYTLLIGFAVYQALPSQKENPVLRRIGYWFALSCAANGVWLILFHYNLFALSMIAMIVLLVSLIAIYTRIGVGQMKLSTRETWFIHIPFSTYLGWITVATVANASYVLYSLGWDGFGIEGAIWAVIMLVVATALTLTIIFTRSDIAYTAVIVWAFVGIVSKQTATPLVAGTAGLMAAVVVIALIVHRFMNRQQGGRTLLASRA